jgi:tripartite-type tricarboxylate transporter receptor subunit TctC
VVEQLFGSSAVQYDASKMRYLGAPGIFTYVLVTSKNSGFTKFEDFLGPGGREIVLGGSNPGSATYDAPILVKEVLGANVKVVSGYAGTTPILQALEKGEVDAFFNPWESVKPAIADRVKEGEFLILGQFSDAPHPDLPNVPDIVKMASSAEARELLRMGVVVPAQFSVQYFLAPGVAENRAMALESAFARTMADKEFLEDAAKTNSDITPLTASQLAKLVNDFLGMPADLKTKLQSVLRP